MMYGRTWSGGVQGRRRIVAIAAAAWLGAALPAGAWLTATNGGVPDGSDAASAVAVDPAGDVVAVGRTSVSAGDAFTVVKHHGVDGTVAWRRTVAGSGDGTGHAAAVAIDGDGAVVAAGVLNEAGHADDFAVVKLDADGTELWRRVVDGDLHYYDAAAAVTVDADRNVIAAGYVVQQATWYDFAVVKWNADGVEQWRRLVNGSAVTNPFDTASAVTVDPSGDVVAAGILDDAGDDLTVIKWNRGGAERWRRTVRGTSTILVQDARAVRTDSTGAVVVAGALNNATSGFDFTVIKWSATGVEQWRRFLNGAAADSGDFAAALAIDGTDAVIAAGTTENLPFTSDWTLAKWNAAGTEIWRKVLLGDPTFSSGAPSAVTTDAGGAVVAAGAVDRPDGFADAAVFKWASDGPELWRRFVDGPADDEGVQSEASESWADVAVDAAGHVAVAGTLIYPETLDDFVAAKLDGATGALTICGNGVVEPGEACDPGAPVSGDCCTDACEVVQDGEACDDGDSDACTAPDACHAGQCVSGARDCALDVPPDPIPVPPSRPIVDLTCEAAPGSICKGALFELSSSPVVRGGASAAAAATPRGPRRLSRKARVRVKGPGRVVMKLKLNGRGRRLLKLTPGVPIAVSVRATIRTSPGSVKTLDKILRIVR